jgi:1-acyl-sn-glycerol-3-phosphate acyltransferase
MLPRVTPPAAESGAARWRRRAVVIPVYVVALGLALALLPVAVALALVRDVACDRRLSATRLVCFGVAYLGCEVLGLAAAFALGIAAGGSRERVLRWHYALQARWACALFAAARRLYGLRLRVDGDDAVRHGPFLLLLRHASLADTLLPAVVVAARHGIRLRWVLKRELLWDPCLDVVGQRLPNVFVRRGSGESAREIAAIHDLARQLGPDDGVLIYPEGTRATPAKRARAQAVLAERNPARAARLATLRHLLPPRPGGALALLEAQPTVDVVFLAHAGLDGAATLGDVWRGALVGRTVDVALWRVPAAEIPREADARLAWLDTQWLRMDQWVGRAVGANVGREV